MHCIFLILAVFIFKIHSFELFCKGLNCYDILKVSRDASDAEINKSFRKLSREYHPDKNKDADAQETFQRITNAYEVLKNELLRKDYNEYLDNPQEHPSYYYQSQYFIKRYAHIDPSYIVIVLVLVTSLMQYGDQLIKHNKAVSKLKEDVDARKDALESLRRKGQVDLKVLDMKVKKRKAEDLKQIEVIETEIITELASGLKGTLRKPSFQDTLLYKMMLWPVTVPMKVYDYINWYYKFSYLKLEYGPQEEEIMTQRSLGLGKMQWLDKDEDERSMLISRKLWIDENMKSYLADIEALEKKKERRFFRKYDL